MYIHIYTYICIQTYAKHSIRTGSNTHRSQSYLCALQFLSCLLQCGVASATVCNQKNDSAGQVAFNYTDMYIYIQIYK